MSREFKEADVVQLSLKTNNEIQKILYNDKGIGKDNLTEDESCALSLKDKSRTILKVKMTKEGKLYNPMAKSKFYNLLSQDKSSKQPLFNYKEVNLSVFSTYVKFLQKRQESLLIQAERFLT